jgi:hypothetical protein
MPLRAGPRLPFTAVSLAGSPPESIAQYFDAVTIPVDEEFRPARAPQPAASHPTNVCLDGQLAATLGRHSCFDCK